MKNIFIKTHVFIIVFYSLFLVQAEYISACVETSPPLWYSYSLSLSNEGLPTGISIENVDSSNGSIRIINSGSTSLYLGKILDGTENKTYNPITKTLNNIDWGNDQLPDTFSPKVQIC